MVVTAASTAKDRSVPPNGADMRFGARRSRPGNRLCEDCRSAPIERFAIRRDVYARAVDATQKRLARAVPL